MSWEIIAWILFGLTSLFARHVEDRARRMREERDRARALLAEWRATPFFEDRNEWMDWVDELGKRVDKELVGWKPRPPEGGSR